MSATENINRIATSVLDKYRSAIPRKAFKQAMAAITAEVGKPDPAPATSSRPIYDMTLLCRASFPATLETDGRPCIAEVTVYRLNAVAAVSFVLDGPETILQHLGLSEADTYITRHEVDDIVTVVHVNREEAPKWQH